MSQSQEKMLTVKQVAGRMNVDEKTVRNWIQRGELRAINIGRIRPEYRIRPDDLDDFIRSRQTDRQDE
jgi:excisionase family DNA binding protein